MYVCMYNSTYVLSLNPMRLVVVDWVKPVVYLSNGSWRHYLQSTLHSIRPVEETRTGRLWNGVSGRLCYIDSFVFNTNVTFCQSVCLKGGEKGLTALLSAESQLSTDTMCQHKAVLFCKNLHYRAGFFFNEDLYHKTITEKILWDVSPFDTSLVHALSLAAIRVGVAVGASSY